MTDTINHQDPISVHVENFGDFETYKTEEVEPEHFVFSTYQVQAGTAPQGTGLSPYQRILAQDPLRKEATIINVDNPVVLCHSEAQAANANNQITTVPFPEGAYLAAGANITIKGTGQVWVAATAVTASRVSVMANRRGA
jgi:hypothetical protein